MIEHGVVLVAGDNAQGKSSVLRGIASLMTGNTMPRGIAKGDSKVMVMDGSNEGELIMSTEESTANVVYPGGKFVTQGTPPQASAIAAGLEQYTDMHAEDRARFLQTLLQAMPTHDAVREALKDQMNPDDVEAVIGLIEREGFDGTCDRLKEKRVRQKGRWEEMTGQRWGDVKAGKWLPQGWSEYDEVEPDIVGNRLAAAQANYDLASRSATIAEAQYQQLVDLVGKAEPTRMALDMAKKQLPSIEHDWAQARAELDALPPPVEGDGIPCPHCGAHVLVRHAVGEPAMYKLEPLEPLLEGEAERRKRRIAEKREVVAEAYRKLEQQQGLIGAAEEQLREISKAEARLKGAKKAEGTPKVDHALSMLEKAKASAARVRLANEAESAAVSVGIYSILIEILGPGGLRRRVLNQKLGEFEQQLALLVKDAASWKAVVLDRETLLPKYGGRPYVLCSRSEQWRCNVLMQIAIALAEGAAVIIIDGADILSSRGQDDLFLAVLDQLPTPVIVGSMYSRPKAVPDLEQAGMGACYWMFEGSLGRIVR